MREMGHYRRVRFCWGGWKVAGIVNSRGWMIEQWRSTSVLFVVVEPTRRGRKGEKRFGFFVFRYDKIMLTFLCLDFD